MIEKTNKKKIWAFILYSIKTKINKKAIIKVQENLSQKKKKKKRYIDIDTDIIISLPSSQLTGVLLP